jgi:hypothetical protein
MDTYVQFRSTVLITHLALCRACMRSVKKQPTYVALLYMNNNCFKVVMIDKNFNAAWVPVMKCRR